MYQGNCYIYYSLSISTVIIIIIIIITDVVCYVLLTCLCC